MSIANILLTVVVLVAAIGAIIYYIKNKQITMSKVVNML